jgi:hypothetical protein
MRISDKNTALWFLYKPDEIDFNLPVDSSGMSKYEKILFGQSVCKALKEQRELFLVKRRYISNTFFEAYERSKNRLGEVALKTDMEESGTLMFKAPNSKFYHTWMYCLITKVVDGQWTYKVILNMFTKHVDNDHISLDAMICHDEKDHKVFLWKEWAKDKDFESRTVAELVKILLFLKYCPLETKVIKAGRKDHHAGQKVLNETKYDIEYIDSNWFTTIIRSEGFGVQGHFRLQPCGPNNSERKLIYIAPFQKSGYTRTAKILNQQ